MGRSSSSGSSASAASASARRVRKAPENGLTSALLFYNCLMLLAWAAILASVLHLQFLQIKDEPQDVERRMAIIVSWVAWTQGVATVLEISMAVMKIVPSAVGPAILQNFGRDMVFYLFVWPNPNVYAHACARWLFAVWASIEVLRYPCNALTRMNACPGWLKWMRYTAFIPLYPAGVVAEVWCFLRGLAIGPATAAYTIGLPNAWNFVLQPNIVVWTYLIVGIGAGFPQMYGHMLRQRKRKLATPIASGLDGAAGGKKTREHAS